MSDITKCSGINCPIKDSCYRFYSKPDSIHQSWFVETPGKWTENPPGSALPNQFECSMYWGSNQDQILNTLINIVEGKDAET